jgi:hypothetical protein
MKVSNALLKTIALAVSVGVLTSCDCKKKDDDLTTKTETVDTKKTDDAPKVDDKDPGACPACGMG